MWYGDGKFTLGSDEFEILATASEDLGYEWHDALLLRDDEGNLFYLSGSGCSCNSLGEYETKDDLIPVKSAAAAVELAKEEFSPEDVFDFANTAVKY